MLHTGIPFDDHLTLSSALHRLVPNLQFFCNHIHSATRLLPVEMGWNLVLLVDLARRRSGFRKRVGTIITILIHGN